MTLSVPVFILLAYAASNVALVGSLVLQERRRKNALLAVMSAALAEPTSSTAWAVGPDEDGRHHLWLQRQEAPAVLLSACLEIAPTLKSLADGGIAVHDWRAPLARARA